MRFVYNVKNLTIFDVNALYQYAVDSATSFWLLHNITSRPDKLKLIKHFFYSKMLECYTNRENYSIMFYEETEKTTVWDKDCHIAKYLSNTLKFPYVRGNMDIESYVSLLGNNSPEYDDIIANKFNFIDKFTKFKKYIKTSGLSALSEKYTNLSGQFFSLIFKTEAF